MLKRALGFILLVISVPFGCAGEWDPVEEVDSPLASWTNIGYGVHYKPADNPSGNNILIVNGGYTSIDPWVERLAEEMVRVRGASLGIRHVYAVRGPNTELYENLEIHNTELAKHLAASNRASDAERIFIVAHSSGTFVADELFRMIDRGYGGVPAGTMSKIAYFNLDGGPATNPSVFRKLGRAWFVYACDPALPVPRCSFNTSDMQDEGVKYQELGGALKLTANNSGCGSAQPGGRWCMHDTLIISRPHNPNAFDLRRDYTDFSGGRTLVTAYFDQVD